MQEQQRQPPPPQQHHHQQQQEGASYIQLRQRASQSERLSTVMSVD
jgi:hypothetical protein